DAPGCRTAPRRADAHQGRRRLRGHQEARRRVRRPFRSEAARPGHGAVQVPQAAVLLGGHQRRRDLGAWAEERGSGRDREVSARRGASVPPVWRDVRREPEGVHPMTVPAASHADTRKYLLERVEDAAVVQLYADGFDELALREKTLVYHLYHAALA